MRGMTLGQPPSTHHTPGTPPPSRWRQVPPMLYESHYAWLVFLSALDVMLTWIILYIGGAEVNWIARKVIERFDLPGAIAFKFALVLLAIVCCEWVGREKPVSGRKLAWWTVAVASIPVVYALGLLTLARFGLRPGLH